MRAIVLAYHNIGCVGIESLLRNGVEIAAVFTHTDDPNENAWFDSVAELAARKGIPVHAPDDINHPMWVERIRRMNPDVLFSFYYRDLIRKPILEIPPAGCLNLHGSLLPAYRGRCPANWVLINGEKQTGVTLHYMTARPDDGDIVAQKAVPIDEDDTARSLHGKLADAAGEMLDAVLPEIREGAAPRKPQDSAKASYYGGRRPEDGRIDWDHTAEQVRNLVRAVTRPYPGAFSFVGGRKFLFWKVSQQPRPAGSAKAEQAAPGTVLSTDPLTVACGDGAVVVDFAQVEGGPYQSGRQLAAEANLVAGARFTDSQDVRLAARSTRRVAILGVNGFIGNALAERLLQEDRYEVYGMDLYSNHLQELLRHPRFHFQEGDVCIHRESVEYHVRRCDVVLPLVAIATPKEYSRNPLRVFELDFEENLRTVRLCVRYGKRLIFPSTSEVYGMCDGPEFDEDQSRLIVGPIRMQRWIYSSSKQLLDRVIWAYGQKEKLPFTLFRPFNWVGPKLDSLASARLGNARVITTMILNLVEGTPLRLVDGGTQKRCFTDLADGTEGLFRIIDDPRGVCNGEIINLGNPDGEASIRELAELLVAKFEQHPLRDRFPACAGLMEVESGSFYGPGYQDLQRRKPSIRKARKLLGWEPRLSVEHSVEETLDYFLRQYLADRAESEGQSPTASPAGGRRGTP